MEKGLHINYQKLFEVKGLPYLFSDILSESYKPLEFLFIYQDRIWKSYLPKSVVERTLEEGSLFFSNVDEFKEYRKNYSEWRESSKKNFTHIIEKTAISKEDAALFLSEMAQNHHYYIKTEFFFVDRAFEKSGMSSIIKNNLEELGKIKNIAREYLNTIFFGDKGYLNQFLRCLEGQFKIKADDLNLLSREEILELFDDKRVPQNVLEARRLAYVMSSNGTKIDVLVGNKADTFASNFYPSVESSESLKGMVANKGHVRGRVKIISTGYENFDNLSKEIASMVQGDVLVADTTSPELLAACRKASAIITNQGGLLSHAAIVSRELNVPCIVGTEIATKVLHDGDEVEVDATKGVVKIIKRAS